MQTAYGGLVMAVGERWKMALTKPSNSNNILIVFVEVQKGWKAELSNTCKESHEKTLSS